MIHEGFVSGRVYREYKDGPWNRPPRAYGGGRVPTRQGPGPLTRRGKKSLDGGGGEADTGGRVKPHVVGDVIDDGRRGVDRPVGECETSTQGRDDRRDVPRTRESPYMSGEII